MVVEDRLEDQESVTAESVRALAHVANRPIAEHVLDGLSAAGIGELILVTSETLAPTVADCIVPRCAHAGLPLRTVVLSGSVDLHRALGAAAAAVGADPCVVHSAAGLLAAPLDGAVARISDRHPDVTVFVHQNGATSRHLSSATQEMLHLAELDPEHAAFGVAGVWVLGKGALELVAGTRWNGGGEVDLTNIAERISSRHGRFDVVPVDAWRSYAGDSQDLLELNRIALDRLQPDLRRQYRHGNQIEGRVWIHDQAAVHASVIVGPAVIGPGARIADAYIGPYTSVGERARIEGTEIERSIISPGASIMHVGGRIVSSVLGRDARVFRDFSLPKALRLRIGEGTEVALS